MRRKRGFPGGAFTLIEMLVVMLVLALLFGLSFSAFHRVTERARAAACVSNLRQLGVGLNLYLGEHDMMMPSLVSARANLAEESPAIDNTLDRYVPAKAAFGCPSDDIWFELTGTSFHWNSALNGQPAASLNFLGVVVDRGHIPVLADKGKRRDGSPVHPYLENKINILYADGHASKDLSFVTER